MKKVYVTLLVKTCLQIDDDVDINDAIEELDMTVESDPDKTEILFFELDDYDITSIVR